MKRRGFLASVVAFFAAPFAAKAATVNTYHGVPIKMKEYRDRRAEDRMSGNLDLMYGVKPRGAVGSSSDS